MDTLVVKIILSSINIELHEILDKVKLILSRYFNWNGNV